MSNEMPAGLAEAIASTDSAPPPSDKLSQVQDVGRELHTLQAEIKEQETALKAKKAQAQGIIHRTLPDLLAELHLDRLGMSDVDADMVLRPYYKAGISSEWEVDRQERAFAWLDENGFGSLIRHDVTYSFRRGEENRAHWLVDLVSQATARRAGRMEEVAKREGRPVRPDETWDMPEPTVRKNVHHSTLTSLVREQSELPADDPARKELPLELLGAVVGRIVEIKPRGKK